MPIVSLPFPLCLLQCGTACPTSWAPLAAGSTCGAASAARRRRPASEACRGLLLCTVSMSFQQERVGEATERSCFDTLISCCTVSIAPVCRNCPECKRLPDVMQLCQGASDSAAAFELCQRQYACAICACK